MPWRRESDLAKLSGENFVRGMAQWVQLRKEQRGDSGWGNARLHYRRDATLREDWCCGRLI